jgi:hypothetical protein
MTVFYHTGRAAVGKLERDLQDLLARYEQLLRNDQLDPQIGSDMSKLVCVRISGYLELAVVTLAHHHCEQAGGAATVKRFSESWLSQSQNPKRETLVEFARRFDHEWGDELLAEFAVIDPQDTFNSKVQTRNDIAHGLSTGINKSTIDSYFDMVVELVEWWKNKLEPRPTKRT